MARHRSSTKKISPDIGLFMECVEEELEPSQLSYLSSAEKEYNEIQSKLDQYINNLKAEVVEKGENCLILQLNVTSTSASMNSFGAYTSPTLAGKSSKQNFHANQSYQQVVGSGILTRSSSSSPANTFFVVDPSVSFMIGDIPSTNMATMEQPCAQSKSGSGNRNRQSASSASPVVATRGKINSKKHSSGLVDSDQLASSSTRTRDKGKNQVSSKFFSEQVYSNEGALSSCGNYRLKGNAKNVPINTSKPTECNSLGGLTVGSKTSWKITDDIHGNGSKGNADSKEVTFSKLAGKTFPSLVVIARPHLKAKYIPQPKVAQERTALDAKVKGVLMYTATKFTEWLIQQGLIRSEQICQNHVNMDLSPVKLKLGMYSDITKFPHSGGYVWISDCCPSQFVSVFSGSIFEKAPYPPATLLKLIYHWACQTNIQNIVQWVKVENTYVKNFFTNMRAVCTQAVHEKYKKMGGHRKKIEVGVISLGTTSQDGNKRQVKVEVLGVMDYENKLIRLRAVEPHSDERSFKRKFVRILQPLEEWVSKESTILTDFTVNKAALNSMGFHTVFQVTSDVKYSNQNVMEYLRRIVPRMFQNTLSLLSRQIIQQFLDELVWREVWGPIPSQAFATIIAHMAEQMKLDSNENFLTRLSQVAANPFKEWHYSVWSSTGKNNLQGMSKPAMPCMSPDLFTATGTVDFSVNQGKGTRTRKRGGEHVVTCEMASSPAPPPKKNARISTKEKIRKREKLESDESMPEGVIKFIEEEENQISLENFYYGFLGGEDRDRGDESSSSRTPFAVKCCVCNKRFTENIVLMKHMVLHCQTEPALVSNLKDVHQCENCFLGFNTAAALKTHSETVHFLTDDKVNSEFLCHICERKWMSRVELVYHMQRTHVEKELPYDCGICRYRTSVYRLFVRHFVQVHKGQEYVFCPFCLKVVEVSHKSIPITSNIFFFLSHLEKHHRSTLVKDCSNCRLSFIHKGILNQHLEADHGTWKTEPGIEFLPELYTGLLMPEPGELIKRELPLKCSKSQKVCKNLFSVNKFKGLDVTGLDEDSTCIECEEFLLNSNHFTGDFSCSKCRFKTCCERAMFDHWAVFHEMASPRFTMGKPTVLDNELFCSCGFSSRSGNRIAKHLAICERHIGYSSMDSALAAAQSTFPGIANQGESPTVLNFLGLMRKESVDDGGDEESIIEKEESKKSVITNPLTETCRLNESDVEDGNSGNENLRKRLHAGESLGSLEGEADEDVIAHEKADKGNTNFSAHQELNEVSFPAENGVETQSESGIICDSVECAVDALADATVANIVDGDHDDSKEKTFFTFQSEKKEKAPDKKMFDEIAVEVNESEFEKETKENECS